MARLSFSEQVSDTVLDVNTGNAVVVETAIILNTTSAIAYLQVFNVPAGSVDLGVTPPSDVIPLPANSGIALSWSDGWYPGGTALSVAGTTGRSNAVAAAIDVWITHGRAVDKFDRRHLL